LRWRYRADLRRAVAAHQDAAAIFGKTGDRHGESMALGNLGLALREAGRSDEAITACQAVAAIFRETGDEHRERFALDNLDTAKGRAAGGG
jgi:hypothetical protein